MPKAKTKKTVARKKTGSKITRKKTARQKTKKSNLKRKAAVKKPRSGKKPVAKKSRPKTKPAKSEKKQVKKSSARILRQPKNIKRIIAKPATTTLNPAATQIVQFPTAVCPAKIARQTNSRPSAHIIDLRNYATEKKQLQPAEQQYAQIISQQISRRLGRQKNLLATKLNQTYGQLVQSKTEAVNKMKSLSARPKSRLAQVAVIKPKAKSCLKIQLPKIPLPEINWQLLKFKPKEIQIGSLVLPAAWKKALISFTVIAVIFVLPLASLNYYKNLKTKKDLVLTQAADALWHLAVSQKAASAQDFYYTQYELEQASQNFSQAKAELNSINLLFQGIIKALPQIDNQYETAKNLIEVGEILTKNAALLTQTFDQLDLNSSLESLGLTEKIVTFKNNLNLIYPDIKTANKLLQQIDITVLPEQYQEQILKLQTALPLLENNIAEFISYSDLMTDILGQDMAKRYLLIFQNNHEIRPTGGFMGSYALLDINNGNVENISIPGGGPYDLEAGLKVNLLAPEPLRILNPRWEFQDANWFMDLPASAEKMIYLYEKSGGPSVDGIIMVNASFMQKILEIVGPIELPKYGKIISAKNFFPELQQSVEKEYDKDLNKPKQIIADLTPQLIDRLLNSNKQQFVSIIDLFYNSLEEKEVQFYFTNYSLEKLVLQKNWGGQMKNTDKDYLAVVSTNIAGEKTDAKIKQLASLQVEIQADGSIINTLSITKTHTGQSGEDFYGVPNVDYLRFYVPEDSQLISASGFEKMDPELFSVLEPEFYQQDETLALIDSTMNIDPQNQTEIFKEKTKTVFANWFKINPGETKTATIKYRLPFKLNLNISSQDIDYIDIIKKEFSIATQAEAEFYSLLWQKQSGKNDFKINVNIKFPDYFNYQYLHPQGLKQSNENNFIFAADLNTDKMLAIIFSQK